MRISILLTTALTLGACSQERAADETPDEIAATGPAAVEVGQFAIPDKFRGEYNASLDACGSFDNDSRMLVEAERIEFWGSTGQLKELMRQADGSVVVVADHEGEGETWPSVYKFELSDNRQLITVTHPQTSEIEQISSVRLRCSKEDAE